MSKTKPEVTNPSFLSNPEKKSQFHLAPQISPFNTVFDTRSYADDKTNESIEKLMADFKGNKKVEKEEFTNDTTALKKLTTEVRAIERQGVLLVGERVHQARELLKKYSNEDKSDETFTAWLTIAFKHRSSAYNMLAFYEFHKALPTPQLQKNLIEMPQKAAYILAARKGDLEQKAKIVDEYFEMKAEDIIAVIQEKFPSSSANPKKSGTEGQIEKLRACLRSLISKKRSLKQDDKDSLRECRKLFDELFPSKE